ncbi:hypothetical protein ACEN85_19165 [Curtobacterium sp. CT11-45]|uniref:hypothetical protein n=1 Tax=Curtobacterium sp. CT11-45 TaxID=3243037 RepID=UPI0039B0F6C4
MRSGPTSRVLLALAAASLLLGAAGCTGSQTETPRPTLAKATAGSVSVAAESDAAERSVRTSRALFASAPGAVVGLVLARRGGLHLAVRMRHHMPVPSIVGHR